MFGNSFLSLLFISTDGGVQFSSESLGSAYMTDVSGISFSCETSSDGSGDIEHEVQQVALPCHSCRVRGWSLCRVPVHTCPFGFLPLS